tara:strand:- start:1362 stop:2021 length:660 start_codon:yes stop_codon:yes gene_type:complete
MNKRFIISMVLILLLSTYSIQNNFKINTKTNIQELFIENNFHVREEKIKEKLSFLYDTNILFLKKKDLEKKLNEIDLIESFKIKKIYPNKIKIKIFEKKPIAILIYKEKKTYFTNKGDLINFFESTEYERLPLIFGDKENFEIFYEDLKKINYPIHEIEKFYFFKSKRWDIITKNSQTIKLPINNYNQSLKNFIKMKDLDNFKKYKIFDYRINNQLILK